MGWFGKKDQVRKDPQTGLTSVKMGDTWIQEKPEMMVTRDFSKYFRDKNIDFGDAIYLAAHFCGFMAGTVLAAGGLVTDPKDPKEQKLIQQMHDAIAEGIKAGREAQNPATRE